MKPRLDYLENWYRVIFYGRIAFSYTYPKKFTCYIFESKKDMKIYCKKHNLKFNTNGSMLNKEYVIICEENINVNLVGVRITEVALISSNMPNLVRELCERTHTKLLD